MRRTSLGCSLAFVVLVSSGCGHKKPPRADSGPPTVTVSQPVERQVTDYVDFTGRTDAPFQVAIRPRVTGYLTRMPFREGSEVKKDDVLFEIDDRPYKAELDRARAEVARLKAALTKAQADLDIGEQTYKNNPGAISQQDLVKRRGARDENQGGLDAAKATQDHNQLNFDWCKVTSPIDGQVSRYYYTLGNLVTQDTTVLTTVVSQDPMYAYFDIDERTMLQILRSTILVGQTDPLATKDVPVLMSVADEDGFPHVGYVNFANNTVDPSTGTLTARGVFANPVASTGRRLLRPGMFVRIRLPLGKPHPALLVNEQAIGTDQGQKFLYVVDEQNKVAYHRIKPGALQDDGLRVISEGLQAGEWIIVNGLQLVRPGIQVETERVPMPVQQPPEDRNKSAKTEPPPAAKTEPRP
jgi:multidrug efflux system membrane fusion protein